MLSFIRKRFPSKDRSNEHLQNIKSNYIENDYQDKSNHMKKTQSTNDLDVNHHENRKKNKKKKKERCSSAWDEFAVPSNTSQMVNRINKSYSNVDYFPMMAGAFSRSIGNSKTSIHNDDLSTDSYFISNPNEIKSTVNSDYIEYSQVKKSSFEIPVMGCQQKQRIINYKDVDHQRTNAIRKITEQRIQKK